MAFFGLDKIINKALAPVGVRPFKGGPYPDAGMGDQAIQAGQQLQIPAQKMGQLGDQMAGFGGGYLQNAGKMPGMGQMGALGGMPNLMN